MTTIALWFDGGGRYGFGNIRRTQELGARLVKRGHAVYFRPLSPEAARLGGLPWPSVSCPASIVVLDVPYVGDEVLAMARREGYRVLALDYSGNLAPDLVVSLQATRKLAPGARQLVGLEYAIIREEFRATDRPETDAGHVLVMLGGGDATELTARAVERVLELSARVTLVQGPLGSSTIPQHPRLRVLHQPADLPKLMAECAWAVTTGGTTMLEFLCLGKPVHVIPRTEAESEFATRLGRNEALLGIGLENLTGPSVPAMQRCARRGPELIDGRGCERIAELLEAWDE